MVKAEYKKKIEKALKDLGTYKKAFDLAIDKLSDILYEYDEAVAEVERSGRFIEHTNKAGATNLDLSPAAVTMRQCRTDALPYMKELGLTPAGLKKLDVEEKKADGLLGALKAIG